MISLSKLAENLENELAWRESEIRFLKKQSQLFSQAFEKNCASRSLIVLLYAHFEGFTKNALISYVDFINSHCLTCDDVNPAIAAAALDKVFFNLRNPTSKCDLFRDKLPDDSGLHRFARDREFVARTHQWKKLPAKISEGFIDTESNLNPAVLSKILYRLGLPHNLFDTINGRINLLLGFRNSVAHGDKKQIELSDLNKLDTTVFFVFSKIKSDILKAAGTKAFQKQ